MQFTLLNQMCVWFSCYNIPKKNPLPINRRIFLLLIVDLPYITSWFSLISMGPRASILIK